MYTYIYRKYCQKQFEGLQKKAGNKYQQYHIQQ